MNQQPQIKYRHDYRAPDYTITDIALDFDLHAEKTRVKAVSQVVLQGGWRAVEAGWGRAGSDRAER